MEFASQHLTQRGSKVGKHAAASKQRALRRDSDGLLVRMPSCGDRPPQMFYPLVWFPLTFRESETSGQP
jgi:hypothetical protein